MKAARITVAGAALAVAQLASILVAPDARAAPSANAPPPRFEVVADWPKPLPNGWVTGEVAGNCVDSQDHVFIVNRRNLTAKELRVGQPAPVVVEFDPEGNVVAGWTPPVSPNGVHGCFVDHQDNVWIAGNGDAIVQKYSHDGSTLLLQIGTQGVFDSSDGTAAGTPLNASHTLLNRPSDIAVDPSNGDIYISDGYGNHRVVVFDAGGTYLRQWGEAATLAEAEAGVGGKFLATVHGVNLGNDGLVYVNDRKGDRIQVFEKDGTFVRNLWVDKGVGVNTTAAIGSAWDMAFSADAGQHYIFDTDGEQEVLWTLRRDGGGVVGSFGRPGHMAGEFTFLHTVAVDSKGNLYTAETIDGRRIQKFRPVGRHP